MPRRSRSRAYSELQRQTAPLAKNEPSAVPAIQPSVALNPEMLLHNPHASNTARRSAAQQIGQTHGNRYLQRTLASIQRSTDPMLRQGSNSAAVRTLQQLLVNGRANIAVDGIFGAKTRQAVVAFQRGAGLTPDGIVGPKTWSALRGGSVNIASDAGSAEILAKIQQIKQLMQQIGASSPTDQPIVGSVDPQVTHDVAHQHDSDDDSWWGSVTSAASSAWDTVSDTASSAWDTASDTASSAWDTVSDTASSAWDTVKETASQTWDAASSVVGGMVDEAGQQIGSIVDTVRETVNSGIDSVVESVSETASEIGQAIDEFTDELKEKFADEIAAMEEIYNDIKHFIENPEDALRKLDEILNGLQKKATALFGGDSEQEEEAASGTVPALELDTDPNICHDTKVHPAVQKKLKFQLQYEPNLRQETPHQQMGLLNYDGIHMLLNYVSDISTGDARIVQVPTTDFGSTGSKFTIGSFDYTEYPDEDYVLVKGKFTHQISWDVTNRPGRANVPESLDGIEDYNWKEAADDLDPDLHKTELGAPKRAKYWAKDITEAHERFHAKDRDDYTRAVIMRHVIEEFNKREIDIPFFFKQSSIERQLKQITEDVGASARKMMNAYIGPPAGELRAYTVDEQAYRLRAGAIRAKAIREGWYKEDKKKK